MNNPIPQNALGIDMGDILSKVSNLKTAKQSREQSNTKFEHYKSDRKLAETQRKKKEAGGKVLKSMFDIPDDITDDQISMFVSLKNNKTAEGKAALEATKQRIEMFGNAAAAIVNSETPVQTYTEVRERLIQNYPTLAEKMPEKYDPKWVNGSMKLLVKADDILKGENKAKEIGIKADADIKVENVKQKNRIALEAIKEDKVTKTKLEKLFDLKKAYKTEGESEEDIAIIDKAIKLVSEGRPSEADKMMAMMFGIPGAETTTPAKTIRPASEINKLFN